MGMRQVSVYLRRDASNHEQMTEAQQKLPEIITDFIGQVTGMSRVSGMA